ncbi:MAG: DUF4231 domain-containing protein [Candidatus Electrothrix sp. AR5]|nr:DUF4231 domain-containing protein [Candidatus Electrothrix sp. AR5]
MEQNKFPPLYVLADLKSIKQQHRHFCSLRAQLALLFTASLITVLPQDKLPFPTEILPYSYLIIIFTSMIFMSYSALLKPEKKWYESRALAESTNTLTWRFIMGAEPFDSHRTDEQAEASFIGELTRICEFNDEMDDQEIDDTLKETPQVTEWMKNVRDSRFEEKKCRYCTSRIQSQLNWYQQKAEFNKKQAKLFSVLSCATYIIALVVACLQCNNSNFPLKWLSEPLLMMAAGWLGWTQAKRYSELASSYSLTSREIFSLQERMAGVTEEQFGGFVNDAETAFSREHTQWAARQIKIIAEKPDNPAS